MESVGGEKKTTRRLRLRKEKKGGRSARKEKQETAEFLWGLVRGRLLQRLGFGCYCPLMPRRLLCLAVLPHLRRRLVRGVRNRWSEAPLQVGASSGCTLAPTAVKKRGTKRRRLLVVVSCTRALARATVLCSCGC